MTKTALTPILKPILQNKLFLSVSSFIVLLIVVGGFYVSKHYIHTAEVTQHWDQADANNTATINHESWQLLLDDYLITEHSSGINRVDYENLIEDRPALEQYIISITAVDPRAYNKDEQMAYWINLYNAATAFLIIEHYPTESITQLGETPLAFGPWDDVAVTIAGKQLSLNDIEHRILRPLWNDSRIHFAVNCASIGCPNLQETAFTSETLEELLNKGAQEYLSHSRGIRFDGDTLTLSSLFDWYKEDFGSDTQEVLTALAQYTSPSVQKKLSAFNGKIRYEYDWSLNEEAVE